MKKHIKEKWVAALRSGKYGQTKNKLRDSESNNFCCLGVLCEIHRKTQKKKHNSWTPRGFYSSIVDGKKDEAGALLSNNILKWSGLKSSNGSYLNSSLVTLNDSGKSFSQIADIIEKYF